MSEFLAVAHVGIPRMTILEVGTWKVVDLDLGLSSQGWYVTTAPSANLLAFVGETLNNTIEVFNTQTWANIASVRDANATGNARSIVFNHDGSLLAAIYSSDEVLVYDTSDWSVVQTLQVGDPYFASHMKFSPDGSFLAVPHEDDGDGNHTTVFETTTWTPVLQSAFSAVLGVGFNTTGTKLVLGKQGSGSHDTRAYDTSSWNLEDNTTTDITGLDFISAQRFYFVQDDGSLRAADLLGDPVSISNVAVSNSQYTSDINHDIDWDIAANSSGRYIAIAFDVAPYVAIYDIDTGDYVNLQNTFPGEARSLVFGEGAISSANFLMGTFP